MVSLGLLQEIRFFFNEYILWLIYSLSMILVYVLTKNVQVFQFEKSMFFISKLSVYALSAGNGNGETVNKCPFIMSVSC